MANAEELKNVILSMKPEEITRSFVEKNFGHYVDSEGKIVGFKYKFNDKITLDPNQYHNKEKIETTLGRLIVNKFLYEDDNLITIIGGFCNKPFDKKVIKSNEEMISNALLEGTISAVAMKNYYDRIQWIGFSLHVFVCGSFTEKTVTPVPEVNKLKEELFKKYADDLKGPMAAQRAIMIEKLLMEEAKKVLKDDPGMDLYNSGARASFSNNYKSMFIVRGPIFNNVTKRYDVLKSCFAEGMSKEDIPSYGSQVISGAYPSAVGTRVAGYYTKKFFATYQCIMADKRGSDCGSKMYRTILLDKSNFKKVKYRWIEDKGKLVCLTPDIAPNYFGKFVKMRSVLYCTQRKPCSKCLGDLFYRIGINNVGMTTPDISTAFMNSLLKAKHTLAVDLYDIKIENMFL